MDRQVELVPLRTGFDVGWRGYRRGQVQRFVRETEAETRLLAADRDAAVARVEELAKQLEELRSDNSLLRAQLDRICRTPIEPDALTERLGRMLELARDEATEITARARAAAEDTWAGAERAGARLRERYERLIGELDVRREEMEAEHRELIGQTRAEVEAMTSQAEQRRRELDEQAERRRQQVETDFEIAMSARRAEAMRALAERRAGAEADVERMLADAREQTRRMVTDARREAEAIREVRDRVAAQLAGAGRVLAEAMPLLRPGSDEPPPDGSIPVTRRAEETGAPARVSSPVPVR